MKIYLITYYRGYINYKDLNLIIDDNTFRLIESIGIIVGIIVAVEAVIAFFLNLRYRVKNLKYLENHPLLSFYDQYQKEKGVIDFFHNTLRESKIEKGDETLCLISLIMI